RGSQTACDRRMISEPTRVRWTRRYAHESCEDGRRQIGDRTMGKLDGKVALISGGARGQGAVEAAVFAREGAKIVFGDVRDDEGKKVEATIRAESGDAVYVHLDVAMEADWQRAVGTAVERYGKLDVLINNAGIVIPRVPIDERTAEEWDHVMAVNAK